MQRPGSGSSPLCATLESWKKHFALPALCIVLTLLTAGCNLLTPLVFMGEHKKKVGAEFDKLAQRRVAIVMWTDPATRFEYPHVRFELSTYVADKLQYEMTQRKQGTEVVDPREVEDYLARNLDAQIDPVAVGRHFKADYVVYLELLEFQIRHPDEPQFLRGRIQASVSVHDLYDDPNRPRRFELTPVQCIHPEGPPVMMSATNSPLVREATYRKFAEMVARKFYEHNVDL